MTRLDKLNKLQDEILDAIITSGSKEGFSCSILASVAIGKSFVFYKLLYRLLSLEWISKGDTIFFWAETNIRERNMLTEAEKFREVYGVHPPTDFAIHFLTYQSMKQGNRVLDCYDEMDTALTAQYSKNIINSTARYKFGMTGTEESYSTVFKDKVAAELLDRVQQSSADTAAGKITDFINKGQLRSILLPRVFTYTTAQAIDAGLISPLETVIIEHDLPLSPMEIKIWKTKKTLFSERSAYATLERGRTNHKAGRFGRMASARRQVQLLQRLPSKVAITRKLLQLIRGKTVVFSTDTSLLYCVTPNVVTNIGENSFVLNAFFYTMKKGKTGKTKYIRQNLRTMEEEVVKEENYKEAFGIFCTLHQPEDFIGKFDRGEIDVIASAKKLGRGITLKGVRNAVLMGYHSTHADMLQKVGRLLRPEEGKALGRLYIIVTKDTWEEKWFNEMVKRYNEHGQVEEVFDLNIVKTINSAQLWNITQ